MPIICQSRKARYIPDMGLATMRTGCGRNKTYAPSGSQQQPLTGPKKNSLYARRAYKEFFFGPNRCVPEAAGRPVFSRSIRKGTEVSLCLSRHRRLSVPVRICRAVPCRRPWRRRGNTLRSRQRGRSGRMPGKEIPPLYPILGKGVRPLCPALPEENTHLYPTF